MTGGQITQTVFEILLAAALIVAIIKREKLADWEEKTFFNIKRKFTIKRRK